jgi:hypothetical protein
MNNFKHNSEANYIEIIQRLVKCIVILLIIVIVLLVLLTRNMQTEIVDTDKNANKKLAYSKPEKTRPE